MTKIRLKERLENAVEAFFEYEKLDEHTDLELTNNSAMFRAQESVSFTEKNRTLLNILRQVFLFLPGTLILFLLVFALTVSAVFLFLFGFGLTTITGFNPIEAKFSKGSLPIILSLIIFVSFPMTWVGLGSLRKKEDICIPVSIMGTGIILGIISGLLSGGSYEMAELIFSESYPLYFFPIALIVPILAKSWVDKTEESKFD
jgi:hypothetical protein